MKSIISQGLAELGLSPAPADHLAAYGQLLIDQNQVMNLTAITEPDQVAKLHMLDCAALLGAADFQNKKVLDVGTGAGFPGVVLKVTEPSIQMTLLDSLAKRLDWISSIAPQLGIDQLEIIHGRAEEYGQDPAYREQFDLVTSRAVADLRVLAELCLPFLKVGGRFLAMKGPRGQEEKDSASRAVSILGGRLCRDFVYHVPGTDLDHRVVVVEKIAPTKPLYPRRFSKIKKSPL